MENASKALLIAGAILIVILLIAIGMLVYNGAKSSIDKGISTMTATEKQIHNAQFEPYLGTSVTGSNIRNLLSKVMANNGNADNPTVQVYFNNTAAATSGSLTNADAAYANVATNASARYSARIEGKDGATGMTDGCITSITILRTTT